MAASVYHALMQREDDARILSAPYGQIDPLLGNSKSGRAIVTRTWEQQAADALPLPGRHPYQSQAVAFAVRTAEALATCTSMCSVAPTEIGASACALPLPDKTAICCQLLKELTQVCPELASPLGRIRECIGQALYSNFYAAADGTLELRQLPYFSVAERLELEKTNLQQKYEECKRTTAAHEEHAQELAWRLGEAQRQTGEARRERDQLKAEIEQNMQIVKSAEAEAAAAREELKGARKDLLRARNEGTSLRALYDIANVKAAEQSALADQHIAALDAQLADALETLTEMAPEAELQAARQEADSVRAELSELEEQFADMQEEHARSQQNAQARMHELTVQLKDACTSAAWQIAQAAALLAPESDLRPVAFKMSESLGCTFAVALGLGAQAPAFLRWNGKLALQAYSAQEIDALVQSILRGQMIAGQPLRQYLLHEFWDPVLEACGRLITACSISSLGPTHHHQQIGNGIPGEGSTSGRLEDIRAALDEVTTAGTLAAQGAYSLVHAAQQARPQSTEARWFIQQLNGTLKLPSVPDKAGSLAALDLARAKQISGLCDVEEQIANCSKQSVWGFNHIVKK